MNRFKALAQLKKELPVSNVSTTLVFEHQSDCVWYEHLIHNKDMYYNNYIESFSYVSDNILNDPRCKWELRGFTMVTHRR